MTRGDHTTKAYVANRAVECLQTDTPSKHAADFCLKEANALVAKAKKLEPKYAIPLWMLLATGARRIDVNRLHASSVKIIKKHMVVRFLWTKGVRRIAHRREIRLPLADLVCPPTNMPKQLTKRIPFECTVAALNASMKRLGSPATTGSFRRLFSRRIENLARNLIGTQLEKNRGHPSSA